MLIEFSNLCKISRSKLSQNIWINAEIQKHKGKNKMKRISLCLCDSPGSNKFDSIETDSKGVPGGIK